MYGICALLDELLPQSPHRPHAALIKYVTDRPGHDRRYAMNITKLATELDWKPRHSLATGLRATVQWSLDYPAWITAIRRQAGYQDWLNQNYAKRGS